MGDDSAGLRDTVAASASHNPAAPPDAAQPRDARSAFEFTRGSLIDRYVVLERLGAGGMSIVYAAYDPELRRRVALKLLLVDVGADQARLLREARAIARLAHPNVVTVFDVGTFEGRVYVTMEYIDGQTLRQWWAAAPRTWRELLAVFQDAARGLSAAHAAGLIHRDFKPENVLIGKDGRVRVLDFGLARRAGGDLETSVAKSFESVVVPGTDVFRLQISRDGALVGTPAYMAPEQLADGTIDHRADQYSFCVALFEGLFGRRPFKGDTAIEMLTAVAAGNLDLGDTRAVPKSIVRVLRRGLSVHATLRFASIDDLSRALARAGSARRHILYFWLGAVVLALAAALSAYLTVLQPADVDARCQDADQRLAEVWNPERAAAVEATFNATHLPFARDTGGLVREQLRRYATDWRATHQLVCDATHVHHHQPPAELRARLDCLDEFRTDLRTAVDIFLAADNDVVEHAVQAASELPIPDRCTSVDDRENEVHLQPEAAAVVQEVREALSKIRVEGLAGRREQARELARHAVTRANVSGFAPIQAAAELHLGIAEAASKDPIAAELHLNTAYDLAEESDQDDVRAAAAVRLVRIVGELHGDTEAMLWHRFADAALRRLNRPVELQVELHVNLSEVHARAARFTEALTELHRAMQLDRDARSYRIADYHLRLGGVHKQRSRFREALEEYEKASSLGSVSLGTQHPTIALMLENRAWAHLNLGELTTAERDYREAKSILEAVYGLQDVQLRRTLNGLGTVALTQGDFAVAAGYYRRLNALIKDTPDANAWSLWAATINLAETKYRTGEYAEAIRLIEPALAYVERTAHCDGVSCAYALATLARAHVEAGHLDLAEPLNERSIGIYERTQGPTFPALVRPLVVQGLLALARDRPADAVAPLTRALDLALETWEPPLEHAELRLALADALWRADRDRPRARELASQAQIRLHESDITDGQTAMLTRVDAWLAAHPA